MKCKPIWTHYLQVKQHYYKDLFSMITRDSKAAIPVLDPTQGKQPYKKTQIGCKLLQKHNTVLQSCFSYLTEQIPWMSAIRITVHGVFIWSVLILYWQLSTLPGDTGTMMWSRPSPNPRTDGRPERRERLRGRGGDNYPIKCKTVLVIDVNGIYFG